MIDEETRYSNEMRRDKDFNLNRQDFSRRERARTREQNERYKRMALHVMFQLQSQCDIHLFSQIYLEPISTTSSRLPVRIRRMAAACNQK